MNPTYPRSRCFGHSKHPPSWRNRLIKIAALLLLTPALLANAQSAELDRSAWQASATNNIESVYNAFDNNINSRWTTGTNQQPDQSFVLDLGQAYTLDRLLMVTTAGAENNSDHPRAFTIELSNDKRTWAAPIVNAKGSPNGTTDLSFAATQGRYLRITQTGSDSFYWWSIHDLRLFGNTNPVIDNTSLLDRSKWRLTASHNSAQVDKAIDGNLATRWTTKQNQQDGQSFVVNLGAVTRLDQLEMVTRSASASEFDYPRGFQVDLSSDGANWKDGVFVGSGDESGTTAAALGNQNAQYIRITQTGADPFYWWSIHELNIFGSQEPSENTPPLAKFVSPTPANNSSLSVGDEINIAVDASDADGKVEKVSLFINDQAVGEDESAPYSWSSIQDPALENLAAGSYQVRAEAIDNLGLVTSVVTMFLLEDDTPSGNLPPLASFASPTNNSEFENRQVISVTVNASDPDGEVANVRLFVDGQFIRQENVAPYEWSSERDSSLANLSPGTHELRADVSDDAGTVVNTSITIIVTGDEPPENQVPSIDFTSPTPANGATLVLGSDINVAVSAEDEDGTVESVALYLDDTLIRRDTQAPYQWSPAQDASLQNLEIGSYDLRAEAADNDGAVSITRRTFSIRDDVVVGNECVVSGDRKQWHRVAVTCTGPIGDEGAESTFTDNRFNVTFSNGSRTLVVPGHFAADGNAADSSAKSGNQWRAYFSPPESGNWNYNVSFRTGSNVAVSNNLNAGSPVVDLDGQSGSFSVSSSGAVSRDMRTRGLLQHRSGESTLRFAGTNDVFIQGGVDSPENIFGYDEFDDTQKFFTSGSCKGILHSFDPHEQDWNPGDPTWGNGRGKSLIGLVNYIADTGANSFYIMMNTVNGDGCDAHPWSSYNRNGRVKSFDVSKLDQWERVLSHMTERGLLIHVMTQETENDGLLNNRNLGLERKLYYRELISRFGHHPALQWNLGEENNSSTAQLKEYSAFFKDLDPYQHPVFVHPKPRKNDRESKYAPLLGDENFDGPTIQTSNINNSSDMYNEIRNWIDRSTQAGNAWVVTLTEASGGGAPFPFKSVSSDQRVYWMWASAMSGGGGFEWYLKGQNQGHAYDLAVEDLREFDEYWEQSGHLVRFFREIVQRDNNINLENLRVDNNAVAGSNDWVLAKPGSAYIVFLREGGNATLNLAGNGNYEAVWFNPRSGATINGGIVSANGNLGNPPSEASQDWAIILTASDQPNTGNFHPDIVRVLDTPLEEITRTPNGGWADSYSVGDRCYCETTFDHNIGPVVVNTELGSMTVREACDLLGSGPGSSGRPKYNDVQCGNGPSNDAGDEDFCPGRVDIQGSTAERRLGCNQIGPMWKFN